MPTPTTDPPFTDPPFTDPPSTGATRTGQQTASTLHTRTPMQDTIELTGLRSASPWSRPEVAQWLVQQRNAGATPAEIATVLVDQGWDADVAAATSKRSLRRADHHRVLYGALCWSAGLGALGLATGLHQSLSGNPDPELTAVAFTLGVILLPLGGFCAWSARRLESSSTHAIWSPTRRMWFATLATCTAIVGLVRLITYVYLVIAALTGATHHPLTPQDQFQVVVSLAIVLPLFAWSFVEWRRSDVVISGLGGDRTEP